MRRRGMRPLRLLSHASPLTPLTHRSAAAEGRALEGEMEVQAQPVQAQAAPSRPASGEF